MKTNALKNWKLAALFFATFAVTSCDDDDDEIDLGRMSATEFVQRAAASDVFEITTGNMANDKSENPAVKTFGLELVTDHTASSNELMNIAKANNINVPMPTRETLPEDKKTIISRLEGKTGVAFDQDFADVQEDAHEDAVELYEDAVEDLDNGPLKDFAQKTLPVLRKHLEHAKQLETQVGS
ncbi:DUF4142 domain-containing protein [Pontibacter arcticus]|uniref:DUF305 domain-containing protein n=1 Tax=Pontibacter arcticus TaxID=2080288 RepID=A0A364RBW1_9BACT|nr:DUF4142 domain-containing protein [Pontibacter arcticus]RAU81818.1 DUF305 domain-containing protein [Pontibacter arcticus]